MISDLDLIIDFLTMVKNLKQGDFLKINNYVYEFINCYVDDKDYTINFNIFLLFDDDWIISRQETEYRIDLRWIIKWEIKEVTEEDVKSELDYNNLILEYMNK